jgi:CheY-like chemotaxis protein
MRRSTREPDVEVVLVVDDHAEVRQLICAILRRAGYAAEEAADGQEALNYLRRKPQPHCILLDLQMPVLDGWGFRTRQLADPELAGIPVVIVTGEGFSEAEVGVLKAQGLLGKPFSGTALLDAINRIGEQTAV